MPDVKIVPTTEEKPTTTNNQEKSQATVHDSGSNTSLSKEEILALKRKNLTKALKRLQKLCKLSTSLKYGHSFDAS